MDFQLPPSGLKNFCVFYHLCRTTPGYSPWTQRPAVLTMHITASLHLNSFFFYHSAFYCSAAFNDLLVAVMQIKKKKHFYSQTYKVWMMSVYPPLENQSSVWNFYKRSEFLTYLSAYSTSRVVRRWMDETWTQCLVFCFFFFSVCCLVIFSHDCHETVFTVIYRGKQQ